jgi:hypothetical protein
MSPTSTASPPALRRITDVSAPQQHLLAAAQLAAGSIAFGAGVALLVWLVGLAVPMFFLLAPPVWLVLPPAAAAGGVGAGAALGAGRALGWTVARERVVVPLVAGMLSLPPLFALAAVFGARALDLWWLWILAAVGASWPAHRRLLRHPLDAWRPVLVRLLFSLGLAIGALAGLLVVYVGFWSSWLGGSPAAARPMPWLIALLGVAGMLGLAALVVSVGPFRTRAAAALAWAGFGLLAASLVAVMLGVVLQSAWSDAAERAQDPVAEPVQPPIVVEPGTGYPGEEPRNEAPAPSLGEGRAQFAALATATVEAAGPAATWRDDPGAAVREVDCGHGRTMLRIEAEFAMGLVTETTTDEHDREVTEANLAAADRIVLAWADLGLGTPEVLHGEPILGGAAMGAVEFAKVDFAFGVAQPRIEGRCLPTP